MGIDTELLLEPCSAYSQVFEQKHRENTENLLKQLIKQSGIDEQANIDSVAAYREKKSESEKSIGKLNKLKTLRTILIFSSVFCALLLTCGILNKLIWISVISSLIIVGSLTLIFALLNKKIKEGNSVTERLNSETESLLGICRNQVAPLMALFKEEMTTDLISQTVPTLVFDKTYDNHRCDCLCGKYGLHEQDGDDYSTIGLLSGEIIGNPFLFERRIRTWMGEQTYYGHKTIHWTTSYRDSNGRTVVQHHSEVLTASVTKPKPCYSTINRLLYGNEVAPDLCFTHRPSHIEQMSEKEIDKKVKVQIKRVRKQAAKSATGFTEMGNEEFDVFFGGADRNNEVQYRLMFTPLAQKNLLGLMKGASPFGDDFSFVKANQINTLVSEHSNDWEMTPEISRYYSYDLTEIKQKFTRFNQNYFRHVYFDLAVFLSVPIYQQHKPHPYKYADSYARNCTARSAEMMANLIGSKHFCHPKTATHAILKTKLVSTDGNVDKLKVSAFSYKAIHRVDSVTVFGGDGHFHRVSVPWILYVPIEQNTRMDICKTEMSNSDFLNSDYSKGIPSAFKSGLLATLGKIENQSDDDPSAEDEGGSDFSDISLS